jgi:dethiobiotin synthetase
VLGCFVTGTDTGVGKTVLAAAVVAALRSRGVAVAAFKPVLTGLDEPEPGRPADHELLGAAAGTAPESVAPLRFGPPVSPHLAAELAGVAIEPDGIVAVARAAGARSEALVVEGVGGLLVPIAADWTVRDLAVALGLPMVVAARPGLGTISHTLLTVEAARAAGLEVRAVVLTPWPDAPSVMQRSNRETIARLGGVEVATLREVGTDVAELAAAGAALPVEAWLGEAALEERRAGAHAGAARAAAPARSTRTGPLVGPDLRGERVLLRAPVEADIPALWAVMRTPEVGRWWAGETEDLTRERVIEGEEDVTTWVVVVDDELIGMVQAWEQTEPEYRHAGIDIALHPAWHGRGLGAETVRTVARHLIEDHGHHRITIDPAASNAAAIRSYERVGFRPVGVLREYERGADGTWHDGLLMDLLAAELR